MPGAQHSGTRGWAVGLKSSVVEDRPELVEEISLARRRCSGGAGEKEEEEEAEEEKEEEEEGGEWRWVQ